MNQHSPENPEPIAAAERPRLELLASSPPGTGGNHDATDLKADVLTSDTSVSSRDPNSSALVVWGPLHALTEKRLTRGGLNELIGHAVEDERQFLADIEERVRRQDQMTAVRLFIIWTELSKYPGEIQRLADHAKVKIAHNARTRHHAEIAALVRVYASYLSRSVFNATRVNRLTNEIQGIAELCNRQSLEGTAANTERVWELAHSKTQEELIALSKGDEHQNPTEQGATGPGAAAKPPLDDKLPEKPEGTADSKLIEQDVQPVDGENHASSVQPDQSIEAEAQDTTNNTTGSANAFDSRPMVNKPTDALDQIGEMELPGLRGRDIEYAALIAVRGENSYKLYGPFAEGGEDMCLLRDAAFDAQLGVPYDA